MANHSRRAVLTGLGVLTPIGATQDAVWQALVSGTSGIKPITLFDASALPSRIAGEVSDFAPKTLIDKSYRKSLNARGRMVQLGTVVAQFAMQDAGLKRGDVTPERFGVEFGAVMGATEPDDFVNAAPRAVTSDPRTINMLAWGSESLNDITPMWMLKYLPNMPACHVTILFDAQGPSNTLISGEVAGVLAFGEALRIVQRGAADYMLVGG